MTHRVPPHDLDAEQCVLGSIMLTPEAVNAVTPILAADDFYDTRHATVYTALLEAAHAGRPTDAITLAAALHEAGDLERIGGAPYIHTLLASVPTAATAAWYARIVADRAGHRRIIAAGVAITQLGYDLEREPSAAAAAASAILADASPSRSRHDLVRWADIIGPASLAMEEAGKTGRTPGVPTGIAALDDMTGGLKPGQLVIVAGRPGMGKSVFGVEVARRATMHDKYATGLISLEMSRQEIFNRIVAAETGLPLQDIDHGTLTVRQWEIVNDSLARTEQADLHIDDSAPNTLPDITAKARRLHARNPLDLLVVDYLQLVEPGRRRRESNREQEVSEISRGLKLLAKELHCPVIVAAQLNRNVEQRMDKRPHLADLRESGAVEQDADVVIMLYRDAYYNKKAPRPRELELIVAKNRQGPLGMVIAQAEFEYGRITDPGLDAQESGR